MTEPNSPLPWLMPILLRFSAESADIRRLVVQDEGFRCLAEDYPLAHKTLQKMKKKLPRKPETVDEYAVILRDLEEEISIYLTRSRGAPR